MGATDASVVSIAVSDLPPSRHGHRLVAISNNRVIIDFVKMQRHV
jgi:hypothetical protein